MTVNEVYEKVMTINSINPLVKNVEYAVRGKLAIRAEEIKQELEEGKEYPFGRVVNCNIGNPQQLNQQPIKFYRQVNKLKNYFFCKTNKYTRYLLFVITLTY